MSPAAPTALIADDEAPMREQLRMRLQEAWPELRIVAEAANGMEAVAMAGVQQPDIVFLDIRMPGMGGIEAAKQLYPRCHIVFVTAYDQYAVDAFEQGAIDYLLKPVTAERLSTTRARLGKRLARPPQDIGAQLAQLSGLLRDGAGAGPADGSDADHARLLLALQRAAGGRDLAGVSLPPLARLRGDAGAKRALWPRLRALRRG